MKGTPSNILWLALLLLFTSSCASWERKVKKQNVEHGGGANVRTRMLEDGSAVVEGEGEGVRNVGESDESNDGGGNNDLAAPVAGLSSESIPALVPSSTNVNDTVNAITVPASSPSLDGNSVLVSATNSNENATAPTDTRDGNVVPNMSPVTSNATNLNVTSTLVTDINEKSTDAFDGNTTLGVNVTVSSNHTSAAPSVSPTATSEQNPLPAIEKNVTDSVIMQPNQSPSDGSVSSERASTAPSASPTAVLKQKSLPTIEQNLTDTAIVQPNQAPSDVSASSKPTSTISSASPTAALNQKSLPTNGKNLTDTAIAPNQAPAAVTGFSSGEDSPSPSSLPTINNHSSPIDANAGKSSGSTKTSKEPSASPTLLNSYDGEAPVPTQTKNSYNDKSASAVSSSRPTIAVSTVKISSNIDPKNPTAIPSFRAGLDTNSEDRHGDNQLTRDDDGGDNQYGENNSGDSYENGNDQPEITHGDNQQTEYDYDGDHNQNSVNDGSDGNEKDNEQLGTTTTSSPLNSETFDLLCDKGNTCGSCESQAKNVWKSSEEKMFCKWKVGKCVVTSSAYNDFNCNSSDGFVSSSLFLPLAFLVGLCFCFRKQLFRHTVQISSKMLRSQNARSTRMTNNADGRYQVVPKEDKDDWDWDSGSDTEAGKKYDQEDEDLQMAMALSMSEDRRSQGSWHGSIPLRRHSPSLQNPSEKKLIQAGGGMKLKPISNLAAQRISLEGKSSNMQFRTNTGKRDSKISMQKKDDDIFASMGISASTQVKTVTRPATGSPWNVAAPRGNNKTTQSAQSFQNTTANWDEDLGIDDWSDDDLNDLDDF